MELTNIKHHLFNIINEVWKRENKENNITNNNYNDKINEFFERCCNSGYTKYDDILFYDFTINNIYECISYLNKKNLLLYDNDIPIYYLLSEQNIKSALLYFVGIKWRENKIDSYVKHFQMFID